MSGGSSVPAAPSYGSEVSNAQNTAGTATSDAAQTMNTAQALNTNSQNNLTGVLGTANNSASAIANTANQNLSTYNSTFSPLQQSEAQQAQAYGSQANIQKLQGQAVGNANAADQASLNNSRAALAAEGVDPATIGGAATTGQQAIAGAANVSNAGTQAGIQAQQQAFGMENTANQLGTQVGQLGTAGAATAAGTAEGGQASENQTNAGNISNLTAGNTFLNTDVNANNSATNAQNTGFQNQQTAYQDQQQANAATGQLVGSVIGAAGSMMMEEGGPVPDGAGIPMPRMRPMHGPRMRATRPAVPQGIPAATGSRGAWTTTDYSSGGPVTQQGALPVSPIPGSTDTKPAMLTPGEFVIPNDVVAHAGAEHFHNEIDKIRAKANTRRAIPVFHPPHQSMQ